LLANGVGERVVEAAGPRVREEERDAHGYDRSEDSASKPPRPRLHRNRKPQRIPSAARSVAAKVFPISCAWGTVIPGYHAFAPMAHVLPAGFRIPGPHIGRWIQQVIPAASGLDMRMSSSRSHRR
jgi:hypothetical protein